MATITYKTLTKKIKNKKCKDYGKTMELKVIPAVKQYEFIPDVWDNIMNFRKKPIEAKLWKMGIPPLATLLIKCKAWPGFKNLYNVKIPLEKRKTMLIKPLMDYHLNKGNIVLEEKKKKKKQLTKKNNN